MVFLDWKERRGSGTGQRQLPGAGAAGDALPGWWPSVRLSPSARASRGVYFSIITQALTYAAMLLFFRNETGFGGNNGFTDFKRILGYR